MTNEIAFTIMIVMAALTGIYIVWWTRREERKNRSE